MRNQWQPRECCKSMKRSSVGVNLSILPQLGSLTPGRGINRPSRHPSANIIPCHRALKYIVIVLQSNPNERDAKNKKYPHLHRKKLGTEIPCPSIRWECKGVDFTRSRYKHRISSKFPWYRKQRGSPLGTGTPLAVLGD